MPPLCLHFPINPKKFNFFNNLTLIARYSVNVEVETILNLNFSIFDQA